MKRKLIILGLAAIIFAPTLYILPVGAASESFNQQILPLNCLFTTIDAGTGTLDYLTPKACGVIIPTPKSGQNRQSTSPSTESDTSSQAASGPYFYDTNPGSASRGKKIYKDDFQLPWQNLATTKPASGTASSLNQGQSNRNSVIIVTSIATVLLIFVVLVFVL